MKRSFLTYLQGAALALLLGVSMSTWAADNYPSKPVKIVVPFAPGGIADLTARVVAQKVSEQVSRPVIVENRPGAGGIAAASTVAKADPDGYTLLLISNGTAVSSSLFKSLPYDALKDFEPISTVGFFDIVIVANKNAPFNTVPDLVSHAKANPGKLNVATINVGSTQNLAAEMFKLMAGVDFQIVPYRGTPDAVMALTSGQADVMFEILGPTMSHLKSGSVKPIALTSDKRFSGLPDVPIAADTVPGYVASSWNGIAAPAKTPQAIIDRLYKEISIAIESPQVKQRLFDMGVTAQAMTPKETKGLLASDIKKWADVIEKAKIQKQ